MIVLDIPKSGKCGNTVWQRNRYCQYSYPSFVPFNPRTPAQVAVRGSFGAVSARGRELTGEERLVWCAVARTMKSKPRLQQCGPLTGFLLFVKVNVPLANRGLAQVDLPTEGRREKQECSITPPKAVPDHLDGVFVSRQCAGRRGTPVTCLSGLLSLLPDPPCTRHARDMPKPCPSRAQAMPAASAPEGECRGETKTTLSAALSTNRIGRPRKIP